MVQTWLIEGHSAEDIREALELHVPKADAGALVREAAKAFAALAAEDRQSVRGWCLAASRELFRKMNDVGDYAGALSAVKLVDKLAQANTPKAPEGEDLDI